MNGPLTTTMCLGLNDNWDGNKTKRKSVTSYRKALRAAAAVAAACVVGVAGAAGADGVDC